MAEMAEKLAKVSSFVNSHDGKDKCLRTVQYVVKYLALSGRYSNGDLLASQLGAARRAMRLGRSIQNVMAVINLFSSTKQGLDFWLVLLRHLFLFGYISCDNVVFAIKAKVIQGTNADVMARRAARCWGVALLLQIVHDAIRRNALREQSKEAYKGIRQTTSTADRERRIALLRSIDQEQQRITLTMVKNACDLPLVLLAATGTDRVSPRTATFGGIISSIAGAMLVWRAANAPNK